MFNGTVSAEFGNLVNLQILDLHHNKFTSKIPETICSQDNLIKMDLSTNNINGSIPDNINECSSLSEFL